MTAIRAFIKRTRSWVPVLVVFLLVFNYCGFQAIGFHDEKSHDHAGTHSPHEGAAHHHGSEGIAGADSPRMPYSKIEHAASPGNDGFCCPEMFCCSSLKLTGDIKELLYRFTNPLTGEAPAAAAMVISDPYTVVGQQMAWLHETGPPALIPKVSLYILEYPAHGPPAA